MDEEPLTIYAIEAFELVAQHEDKEEGKGNILILMNDDGPSVTKFSWKDFKVYNYVLDVSSSSENEINSLLLSTKDLESYTTTMQLNFFFHEAE